VTEKSLVEQHIPVMLERVVELLTPCLSISNPIFVDATLGLAGHTEALLNKFSNLKVIGFDRDPIALKRAKIRLEKFQNRIDFINETFDTLEKNLQELKVDAILFDLGVSSMQLDLADRGFSYSKVAPLDMRMDQNSKITAESILNSYSHGQLAKIIQNYGEEKFASKIAENIIKAREAGRLKTTQDLAELVKNAIPAALRRVGGNPAKRTFQAIRIEVNEELAILKRAIPKALSALNVGGRLVVMSYQSLEDRIVKQFFSESTTSTTPQGLPMELPDSAAKYRLILSGSEAASESEMLLNPRSQSMRLRAIERVAA